MSQNTSGYTADEIQGAVQGLMQTSVRYHTDSLGAPQTPTTFSDIQQAALGVFLLFPTAVFYAVLLGASRLNEDLQLQAQQVNTLLNLLQVSGRTALPITDTTPLSNASVALASLHSAAATRSSTFVNVNSTPAFQRFSKNVDSFLATNGSNVKAGGAIVPTPQDAKAQIRILYSKIVTLQASLIQRATYLQKALSDYTAANLPAVMASSVLQNASQNMSALVAQLEPQSPIDRLGSLRDTILQLLATRAVVRQVGGFSQPSSVYAISGDGVPYADAGHPATPASLAATLYAPYEISTSPIIEVTVDGVTSISRNLNNSQFAELFGTSFEPFVITSNNNNFVVEEVVSGTFDTVIFFNGTYTAAALAVVLNNVLNPDFTVFAQGPVGFQYLDVRYTGSATPLFKAQIRCPTTAVSASLYLGFPQDAIVSARPSTARQVVANLNQFSPSLLASTVVDPVNGGTGLLMRSEPTDPSRIVAYKARGSGTVAVVGAHTLTLTVDFDLFEAGVETFDVLVIRDGANSNTKWDVGVVTTNVLVATGSGTPVNGVGSFEIGPDLAQVGYVVEVPGTGVNHGIYGITDVGPTALDVPFEFEIDGVLHGVEAQGGVPYFFTGNVGREKVVFSSVDTSIASSVLVSGAASPLFFSSPPAPAVGATPWVSLPETVPGLGPGDTLELYEVTYNQPSTTLSISSVQEQLLGLNAPVPNDTVFHFVSDSPPPFAILRSGAYAAYLALSQALVAWLALPANQSRYFPNLQPLLSTVVNAPQATPTQVNTAITEAQKLQAVLVQASSPSPTTTLEHALLGYSVNRVEPLDNLVKMYTEKGATRAIDMLLQGQFSGFFGLTQATVSHSGALIDQIQTVAREDLPVRKGDRTSTVTSTVSSSSVSPDFEYDRSDSETGASPNVPTEFEKVSPSEAGFT